MKSRETLMRLRRFHVDEKRRKLTQIETMIAEFERMASDLDREIAVEESRSGITDKNHFAYPTYARAALQRRDNLLQSATDLARQLDDARREVEDAIEEFKKFELLEEREHGRERFTDLPRDENDLTQIPLKIRNARA